MVHNQQTATLPALPGVYLFKDRNNAIIYIGKAKSLKKRVGSYFAKQYEDWKIHALIEEHGSIDHVVTHTEQEALLLEAQLVKEYQPKYNTLLKTGNPFLYLHFSEETLPTLSIVRHKKGKGIFFGPFIHKQQARRTYDYLIRTFKLYRCKGVIKNGCLDFHLERCAGPCTDTFDAAGYRTRIELAQRALEGNAKAFMKTLQDSIAGYTRLFEFEKARNLSEYAYNIDIILQTIKARFTEKKYAKEVVQAVMPSQPKQVTMEYQVTAQELQNMLHLHTAPITIDCFDISHFQSNALVGSCIRFTGGKPDKQKFRRFKIKTLSEQNDYAALQEIVTRRYRDKSDIPDLVLIDGGKGQLSSVIAVLPQAQIISLAKREERVFTQEDNAGIKLDIKTAPGKLLIEIRDYAHHFAITYHQLVRKKNFAR